MVVITAGLWAWEASGGPAGARFGAGAADPKQAA